MWTSVSKRRLQRECGAILLALAVVAALFRVAQNRGLLIGGAIALPKLMWLSYTILAWFLLPLLLARDDRVQVAVRRIYQVFFWNMATRGILELAMIYFWKNWHPYIGASHDLFSIALILVLAWRVRSPGGADLLLIRHSYVLAAMLGAEIGFAIYFAAHFMTKGNQALYFVPNEGRYTTILMSTALAVACLTPYFAWFLYRWLVAREADS